jgi:aminopeptidase
MRPVQDQRVKKTKWVVLRWPSPSMAQLAGMSTEAFEDFYFDVCTLDYRKLQPGMKALKKLMESTDRVEIRGRDTDLRFSIKGIPAIVCGGDRNIPDGEVFTAPVRQSVEGHVTFNAPTIYQGTAFDGIRLEFRQGKVVRATGNETKTLNRILDSDAGARYIGEFSLAFNPYILRPMRDILFDEKIAGSFHFTPGQAYEEADNGNRSQVHWDMVHIQRPEYGGGEVRFDGKVIRRDGEFLPTALKSLNRSSFKRPASAGRGR